MDYAPAHTVTFLRPTPGCAAPAAPVRECGTCAVHTLCVGSVISSPSRPVQHRRLWRGQALFTAGEPFAYAWGVRSGTLKTCMVLHDGHEQVTGLHLPGELIGADGLATGRHATTAIALEDCTVCAVPLSLDVEGSAAAALHSRILSTIAMAALRERELTALLASSRADERVAAFLVDVADRLAARGWSPREFHLRMTRAEIGSLLGVTLETVSRSFSALAREGIVEVQRRHVRIVDRARLDESAPPAALRWMRAA